MAKTQTTQPSSEDDATQAPRDTPVESQAIPQSITRVNNCAVCGGHNLTESFSVYGAMFSLCDCGSLTGTNEHESHGANILTSTEADYFRDVKQLVRALGVHIENVMMFPRPPLKEGEEEKEVRPGTYDAVILKDIIHYVSLPELVKRVNELLKPEGAVAFSGLFRNGQRADQVERRGQLSAEAINNGLFVIPDVPAVVAAMQAGGFEYVNAATFPHTLIFRKVNHAN